jgi:hypothetical protein
MPGDNVTGQSSEKQKLNFAIEATEGAVFHQGGRRTGRTRIEAPFSDAAGSGLR